MPTPKKVIGPSGRPILVGGPTWKKLSESQQKSLIGISKNPKKNIKTPNGLTKSVATFKNPVKRNIRKSNKDMYLLYQGDLRYFDDSDQFAKIKMFAQAKDVAEYVFDIYFDIGIDEKQILRRFAKRFKEFVEAPDTGKSLYFDDSIVIRKISTDKAAFLQKKADPRYFSEYMKKIGFS